MITIDNKVLNIDVLTIIEKLREDLALKGINRFNKIKVNNDNIQVTCPIHKNGQEQKPSAGIVLKGSEKVEEGTIHCFTCGYTATLPELVSDCFGFNDNGKYGKSWLLQNFASGDLRQRTSLNLGNPKINKKVKAMDSYQITGILSITNNEDTYNYDVKASYKAKDNYRVSLVNKSNNHEQIILKSNNEVYVITPALNKSFKFQSNWPDNNSQIYILSSIVNDMNSDNEKTIDEVDSSFVITTKVNYPNNIGLVKQKIYADKDGNITKIEVLNDTGIVEMVMTFDKIDDSPTFNDNYFELNSIISDIDKENIPDSEVGSIDDVIYPLYIPVGTVLVDQEKIAKNKGERVILTFDGEKPFLLVEETATATDEFSIIPIFGEPHFLNDTVGAITDNSVSWTSGGIDYYLVSDVMGKTELIEIANSISTIPIMK